MNVSKVRNYRPWEFAKLLNVSVKTLQRWDRDGVLVANKIWPRKIQAPDRKG